jgi:Putative quorum-sensing-regulated virulence factor
MFPSMYFPPSFLRVHPLLLPLRRLRPILASSYDEGELSKLRKLFPRARDKKIEIGRYKGRMLGTLPSSYLKWLADQEDNPAYDLYNWPLFAKIVLEDPVYQDRIEYEPALRIFEGGAKGNFILREDFDFMKAYRDIGDNNGWDWDDKEGWSKVNRDFIGTSFSGRIPRKKDKSGESAQLGASQSMKNEAREKNNIGCLDDQNGVKNGKKHGVFVGKKREERIERMRLRREEKKKMVKNDKVLEEGVLEEKEEEASTSRVKKERARKGKGDLEGRKKELDLGRNNEINSFPKIEVSLGNGEVSNPFPGRDALFQKLKREGKIK